MKKVSVAAFSPEIRVSDIDYNTLKIKDMITVAEEKGADLLFLPEFCITSRSCGDLFSNRGLLEKTLLALEELMSFTSGKQLVCVFSAPLTIENNLYEAAVFMCGGQILSVIPRTDFSGDIDYLRWFTPWHGANGLYKLGNGREVYVCDSLQMNQHCYAVFFGHASLRTVGTSQVSLVYTSSVERVGRISEIRNALRTHTKENGFAAVGLSPDISESTGSGVCSGFSCMYFNGKHLGSNAPFSGQNLIYDTSTAPLPEAGEPDDCWLALEIQGQALAQRLKKIWVSKIILGISGGLDSTQALIAGVRALDIMGVPRTNLIAVTMPCFGTTSRTKSNAQRMAELCGVTFREVSIRESVIQHLKDIGHDGYTSDVTYENAQARERTQVLMDLANMENAIVLGTGDMSEAALGWCTFNGDHISMYNVNCNLTKTFLRKIVRYEATELLSGELSEVLLDVIDTPVSPELKPAVDGEIAQKTEDILGPYEVLDYYLECLVKDNKPVREIYSGATETFADRYLEEDLMKWLKQFIKRFFNNQFKRNCVPDGPMVVDYSISPFRGWIMTSDTSSASFLSDLE